MTGLLLLVSLSACGTGVRLDQAPVEDRVAAPVSAIAPAPAGQGAGVEPRGVSGVEVASADVVQPAGMSRVVYFDFDRYDIRPEFMPTLEANARHLNADRSRRVALEGHTDERGGREYNLALGQKRAEAVRRTLSLLGVNEAQMEAVSFGEEKPAAAGFDEAAFAQNRRVELSYRR
ncbi:peptidoglycan-associated lipoprotein Pal [Hydrogenophaga sp.]|uniref:peptidoglycan-associated lipoprotein Pal n=1 Tax=Hydrogenophaga sp. TaxID=1904254 RepID=UPI0025BCF216|nr:peptidoglycan-associated lipoprotein Pal [Hydrogenophaga sp.]